MLRPLSNSVALKLPTRDVLIRRLGQIAKLILDEFSEVEEVILFGSLARGDYGTDSDADILLILDKSPYVRYFDRIPKYAPIFLDFYMPVDVFPYTKTEIEKMVENNNLFIKSMFDEGLSLGKKNDI